MMHKYFLATKPEHVCALVRFRWELPTKVNHDNVSEVIDVLSSRFE